MNKLFLQEKKLLKMSFKGYNFNTWRCSVAPVHLAGEHTHANTAQQRPLMSKLQQCDSKYTAAI